MDTKMKLKVGQIIDALTDDIDYAKSELHRLTFVDEAANPPTETQIHEIANDNTTSSHDPESHHGVVTLPLHYTLGHGVPEALGDDVEAAVFSVFRRILAAGDRSNLLSCEVESCGGMAIDLYFDRDCRSVCLHLELVRTDSSIDWEEAEEVIATPQRRSLN